MLCVWSHTCLATVWINLGAFRFFFKPGKVASPARGQLNRKNEYFPVRVRAREFGLARRVRQSRPASACSSQYIIRLNLVLTCGIPPEFRGGVHLLFVYNRRTPSGQSRVYRVTHLAMAYRWRSLPRVRRHGTNKPQASSERVLPWQVTMDQLIFAPLSHTHYIGIKWAC